MAEKGGKGYYAWKGKTASKSVVSKQQGPSNRGKEDASLDKSIHVEIDSSDSEPEDNNQGSSKSNGKTSADPISCTNVSTDSLKSGEKASLKTPAAKGDLGKGGKTSNVGKAVGKGSLPRSSGMKPPITEVELKLELDIPKSARILMDCEAAEALKEIHEHMTILSEDPKIKVPESFGKALQYSKSGSHYTDTKSVRQLLDLKTNGVNDGEICMIGNVCPDNLEEVYALIPSLKANIHKNEGPIRDALLRLAKFKSSG
ncbi:DNA-directed RNA polymerases IV and V subunit 4-like isoform X2 [Typha latifolia]|uniref:DNA-directed RNA polymerases IV and V subunit 4-like isoform X2 n=1 Tax=Typha latifolia TaxID=4733 RepID=UPI003C2E14B7